MLSRERVWITTDSETNINGINNIKRKKFKITQAVSVNLSSFVREKIYL